MWRISDFSTSVMWRHLKFLHMWRNFQFPHNCHTWKAEIFPHDNFFSTNNISDISDKYEVCNARLENINLGQIKNGEYQATAVLYIDMKTIGTGKQNG